MKKINLIIGVAFSVIAIIILSITNINNTYEISSNVQKNEHILNGFDIDYVIDSADSQQQLELESKSDSSIYSGKIPVHYTTKIGEFKETLLFQTEDDLYKSIYKENLIIEKSNKTIENKIYINQTVAKNFKLNVNDDVEYNILNQSFTATVYAVFSDSVNSKEVIAITLNSQLEELGIFKKTIGYYDINESADVSSLLDNFKPNALLKTRDQFSNDADYNSHLQWFNSLEGKDYISNTDNFKSTIDLKITEYSSDYNMSVILTVIITSVLYVLYYLISSLVSFLLNKKKIKNANVKKAAFIKEKIINTFIVLVVSLLMVLIVSAVLSQMHVTTMDLLLVLSTFIAISIVSLIGCGFEIAFIKSI